MGRKVKHLRVRLTESEFQALVKVLIAQQRTKSEILRNALNNYLVENTPPNRNIS